MVGETALVVGISRFLHDSFGLIINNIIITDNPTELVLQSIKENLKDLDIDVEKQVHFTEDTRQINQLLFDSKPEIILGSSLEQDIASRLGISLVPISSPVYDRVILNKSYTGYDGAITLIEDVSNELLEQLFYV